MQKMNRLITVLACFALIGCEQRVDSFSVARIDREVSASAYPTAINPALVGTYPGPAKAGAGYFYDEVLEYRVWLHPEDGAEPLAGNEDYFAAFAKYEKALAFSKSRRGAEPPLVLVRQRESIDEPTPGTFEWVKEERVTEWNPEWLAGARREPDSIPNFLEERKRSDANGPASDPARPAPVR